jgi:hypothetical protein
MKESLKKIWVRKQKIERGDIDKREIKMVENFVRNESETSWGWNLESLCGRGVSFCVQLVSKSLSKSFVWQIKKKKSCVCI